MKKFIYASIIINLTIVFLSLFSGCNEDPVQNTTYITTSNGAYIISEGTNSSNSKLSFYSISKDTFYQSIFPGSLSFPDGIEYYNGDIYLLEQGTFGGQGKLYQLDSNGGIKFSSNPFGTNPYSLAITGNRAYITNGPASKVIVMDLSNLSVLNEINVGVYPQEILYSSGKIFVCNTSAFGGSSDSTVSVIDPSSNSVTGTLILRKDPTSVKSAEVNNQLAVFVGCQGGGGVIYKIEPATNNKLDSFFLPNGFDRDLTFYNGSVYFISAANNIDKLDLSSRNVSTFITNPGIPAFFYGYNIDVENGKHYVLDAKNFNIDGTLLIYNSNGAFEKSFTAGVAPRRIVFKTQTSINR